MTDGLQKKGFRKLWISQFGHCLWIARRNILTNGTKISIINHRCCLRQDISSHSCLSSSRFLVWFIRLLYLLGYNIILIGTETTDDSIIMKETLYCFETSKTSRSTFTKYCFTTIKENTMPHVNIPMCEIDNFSLHMRDPLQAMKVNQRGLAISNDKVNKNHIHKWKKKKKERSTGWKGKKSWGERFTGWEKKLSLGGRSMVVN